MSDLALASFAAATDTHLVGMPRTARFAVYRATFDEGAEVERLRALGFRFLGRSSGAFPPLLGAIHDPPPGLYLRGDANPELLRRRAVAVVGARACSAYGRQVARRLGRELGAAGLVVVSGLARGVDAEAHRGALDVSAPTIAVLGCGIDRDYPAAHRALAAEIAAVGLLISEYAPGIEPAPWRFPARKCGGLATKPFPLKQAVVVVVPAVKCRPRVVPVWSRRVGYADNGAGRPTVGAGSVRRPHR